MKRHWIVLLAYGALALLATHPLWQHLGDDVPGDVGDPVLNTYILAWDTHALVVDPLHLFDANVFYPLPNTLAYSENLIGDALLALPLSLLSGEPVLGYNFVFLLSFVLAGFGMYLFMLRVTRRRGAAFAAGIAFAFAPYRLASLAHLQLLAVEWLPFVANELWQLAEGRRGAQAVTRSLKHPLLLALFMWLQVASSLHGALFALLMVLLLAAFQLGQGKEEQSRKDAKTQSVFGLCAFAPLREVFSSRLGSPAPYLAAALLLAAGIAPLAAPYVSVLDALRAARPPDAAQAFAAVPADFAAAAAGDRLFGGLTLPLRQRGGSNEEHTLFMGALIPLLALAGLWRRERVAWWLAALAAAALLLAGNPAFTQAIPLASLMRVPARWSVVLSFALAALAGLAISGWSAGRGRKPGIRTSAVYTLIVSLIFLEGFSAPLALAGIGSLRAQTGVYHFLAQQPDRAALIELPLYVAPDPEFPEGKRMYASALHGHPLVNGYSGFTPPRQTALAARLKQFPDDESLTALRDLAGQGVRYVLVHSGEPGIPRGDWVRQNRARAVNSGVLRLLGSFDDNDLFELVR